MRMFMLLPGVQRRGGGWGGACHLLGRCRRAAGAAPLRNMLHIQANFKEDPTPCLQAACQAACVSKRVVSAVCQQSWVLAQAAKDLLQELVVWPMLNPALCQVCTAVPG